MTPQSYAPPPPAPVRAPGQGLTDFGLGVLKYALAYGPYGLDAEQLEGAQAAATLAVTGPLDAKALETIQQLRSTMSRQQARRREEQLRLPDPADLPPVDQADDIEGGTKVPVHPRPPTRPSPGQAVPLAPARPQVPEWRF